MYREISIGNEIFAENISLNRALQVVRIYTLNITEQKRAEREREHMFADLEQKNAELERFAYTASHDLKTPLITIRGFLGFVERDAEVGDMVRMRQDLARISNATLKMQELLDSLLESVEDRQDRRATRAGLHERTIRGSSGTPCRTDP